MSLKPCPRCARPIEHLSSACNTCHWTREVVSAPAAVVPVVAIPAVPAVPEPPFLFVPTAGYKLAVLSVTSLGIYQFVWLYRSWSRLRERGRADVSPFWRTVFAPFFVFDLCRRVATESGRRGAPPAWSSTTLGVGFFALSLAWRLPDPWWLVTYLSMVPLLPVLGTVNALNRQRLQPEDSNARLTGTNWAVITVGGLVLCLAVWGTLLPPPPT